MIWYALMLAVFAAWLGAFRWQWRHRADPRPGIDSMLVGIEMALLAGAAAAVEFLLLLGAVFL